MYVFASRISRPSSLIGLGWFIVALHSPAKIPGPRMAVLTSWYECYYNVWLCGQYFRKIAKMHQKHGSLQPLYTNQILGLCLMQASGPIVRISPNEVYLNDPDYMDSLYPAPSSAKPTDPSWWASEVEVSLRLESRERWSCTLILPSSRVYDRHRRPQHAPPAPRSYHPLLLRCKHPQTRARDQASH
jgi:hypothetical protein